MKEKESLGSDSAERPFGARAMRPAGRRVVYCVVPADLAGKLHEPLRRHFAEDSRVEVVVERRCAERRGGSERRAGEGEAPARGERRTAGPAGRRVAERRASLVPADRAPDLPRRARRYAERIAFLERVEPSTQRQEDEDTARVVLRFQAGDRDAYSTLYSRYYGRVYGYLRVALRNRDDAEDATQEVFVRALEAMPRYELGSRPFRHWLFTIVRNHALDELEKLARVEPMPNEELERRAEERQAAGAAEAPEAAGAAEPTPEAELAVFDWLTDPDLRIFVERLPVLQRQVLILRYALGFTVTDAASLMERTPNAVSALQYRALATLEERLRAIGRAPEGRSIRSDRPQMRAWVKQATVLRSRRFSLM